MKNTTKTKVLFRVFKKEGDVIAIFPEETGDLPDVSGLMGALRQLSPQQRAAIVLHYEADLPEIHKRALEGDSLTKDVAASLVDRHLHTPFAYPTLREQE